MRVALMFILLSLFAIGCKDSQPINDSEVIASVGERVLKRSSVVEMIPRGVTSADSLLFAEGYIKKWMKDALVYDVALRNLGDEKDEINNLVEEYRYSLVRYRYQDRLVKEKLTANIRESERLNYYEENQQKFVLDKSLIKGLFLKIPVDAPGLNDVKVWYRQTSEDALEKIEKYSLQNASIYEYFYDKWVEFDEVMDNIPMHVSNSSQFLKSNRVIEMADSSYCYLLNIKEYITSGTVAPYDYAIPQITEILINQRKVEFLKRFEEDLYIEGLRNGKAKRYQFD